jgi:hypothetical protein
VTPVATTPPTSFSRLNRDPDPDGLGKDDLVRVDLGHLFGHGQDVGRVDPALERVAEGVEEE